MDRRNRINIKAIETELLDYEDDLRRGQMKYTRRAFDLIPQIKSPRILDIGCGSGVPTMELARMTDGRITAVDIDRSQLTRLSAAARKAGFQNRLKIMEQSMSELNFNDDSFDIIWAEGSIATIGFEKGISEWRRFLKTGGFLVVHDDRGEIRDKVAAIALSGYELVAKFMLGTKIWRDSYYDPLEDKLKEIRGRFPASRELDMLLEKEDRQIEGLVKNPLRYRSVFFIMQKIANSGIHN